MTDDRQIEDGKAPRGRAVRSFLAGDRTPMWFTIAALLAGAGGTYFIAPAVNAQFEAQKIRTDFGRHLFHRAGRQRAIRGAEDQDRFRHPQLQ